MRKLPLILLFLTACSDPGAAPTPDLALPDPCAPMGALVDGACQSRLDWRPGGLLPRPRDHHGTAIVETPAGAFLYVTGGTNYTGIFDDTAFAPISDTNGTLGPFTATRSMPGRRAGHGLVSRGGRLYAVAGQSNGTFLSSVVSAKVQPDGTIAAWDEEPALPVGRFHIAIAASATHLYAIGGVDNSDGQLPFEATRGVYYAAFAADGRLGTWQTAAELPEPRSHHALLFHGGALYLVGGLIEDTTNGAPMARDVLSSRLGADGAPGPWSKAATLDDPVATLAVFEAQGSLFAIGGLTEDDAYSDAIRRADFTADGLGPFRPAGALPHGRSHVHQTPFYKGSFYSMGGSVDYQEVTAESWQLTFSPLPAGAPVGSSTHALERAPIRSGGSRCPCSARISMPR